MRAKKIIKGEKYYYGKEKRVFKCIKVGVETSFFVDYLKKEHQFYNEDMHIDKYVA
jgi:ribosomal protein L20